MAIPPSGWAKSAPPKGGGVPVNSGTSTALVPPRQPDPNSVTPVEAIKSTPDSRSGLADVGTSSSTIVGQPVSQSNSEAIKASFTAANSTDSAGAAALSAAEKQKNLEAIEARKSGVLGCIAKGPGASTPGCTGECDTVDCLTKMLTGNLLDLDAKKLLCDTISATERAVKRQIDSTGDQLLNAAQTATSLAPVIAPLNALQGFVNKIDPGAVANCFGAQALKDKVNGQFNKAKNTINKFQKGYQDKIADKFNKATAAAQQFSVTPNMCGTNSTATLRGLLG
jgi:hypothetical protein